MSDQNISNSQTGDTLAELPPPSGDPGKADRYLTQLIELINADKLTVSHTDLSKFDPTSLQDHYRLNLKDYEVEVSHNKQPDSGKDFYVILFNNLKYISEQCTEKIILAYMHLSEDQFKRFKSASVEQIERKRKEAEEKRLKEAMTPIDQALEELASSPKQTEEEKTDIPLEAATTPDNQHASINSAAIPFSNTPPDFTESDSASVASS